MHLTGFNKFAAIAVMTGILFSLTGCPAKPPKQPDVPESTQTSKTPEEAATTAPLVLDEDLSKYDLKEGDSLEDVVSKMENKYGIDIVYGNDIRTEFKDENDTITVKPNTNLEDVRKALLAIDEGLNALPKGFLRQLPYGSHNILKIYLTGPITINGVPNSGSPAFTIDSDDELFLTIEVIEDGVVNVPTVLHEITHIVDFKLHYDGLIKEDEWSKLNPEGFTYDNSYGEDITGGKDPKYCYTTHHYAGRNTGNPDDDIWFYYCYSKVNAYEDRATMLENLVIYKMWNYEVAEGLYKCPHMKAKVEYYLKLIEKDFKMTQSDRDAWANAFKAIS